MSKLIGERTREAPADATIVSHALLVRAGYIKQLAGGIWSLTAPAQRIIKNIEKIIREEMNAIDGQEVALPVVQPRELWEQSGRYYTIGEEMARFKDRADRDLCLAMTHEEAAVHLVRDGVKSYTQLPFMIYQFQTKFRDEPRSRGGLIRVREFIMKDAYSFHADQADLEEYYQKAYKAYENIFRRIGMRNFIAIQSDSGMMGGAIAHEFMLLTDIGEDTIAICQRCGYKANMEVAEAVLPTPQKEEEQPLKEVFTADAKEIAEVARYLSVTAEKTIKAVVYLDKQTNGYVVAFIRGDLEVNEAKLKKAVKKDLVPCSLEDSGSLVAGNIGVFGIGKTGAEVVFDTSLKDTVNMVTGANKKEYHISGVCMARDLPDAVFCDIKKAREGDACPKCGAPLTLKNGIEVGNIFQLGTKYTRSMGMSVLGADGKAFYPIMGCYGIGLGRSLASVAEEYADEKGLNWPIAIAPFKIYLCPLRYDTPEVKQCADELYAKLKEKGIETIFDDRDASPGFKFADCDLMGIPVRVVVSPRSLKSGSVEIASRSGEIKEDIPLQNLFGRLEQIFEQLSK
ncbi:MAG: proline--tRNA ligase [Christensenellales bacterium]|jgi:prolyl-tRNA synthetase